MSHKQAQKMSRREREIMDILFARGRGSAAEVLESLPDAPSYSAVRTFLARLEKKGYVSHFEEGRTYVYAPVGRKDAARENALGHLLKTFFDNSTERAVAALLARKGRVVTDSELDKLTEVVRRARKEGR
jgi:predicted transcriptional regulator